MKIDKVKLKVLILGLLLIVGGCVYGGSIAFATFAHPGLISWSAQLVAISCVLVLLPVIVGFFFLLQLCEETEEDRQDQEDRERLARQLRE